MAQVIQYKKRKTINMGLLIYSVIFIYILISVFSFINRKNVPVYEVESGSIKESDTFRGIIIRNEEVILSTTEGYVKYYFRDGDKASKNSVIATIGHENTSRIQEVSTLNAEQITSLRKDFSFYNGTYKDASFYTVYEFKNQLESKLLEYHQVSLNSLEISLNSSKEQENYAVIVSEESGIISYTMDGLEDLSMGEVSKDIFNESVNTIQLLSQNIIGNNDPIYKIIKSQTWKLVFPETDKLNAYMGNSTRLTIKSLKDNLNLTGQVSRITNNGESYIVLTFTEALNSYIKERFIDFEIVYQEANGIKIPNTSIVSKPFHKVPQEYITRSGQQRGVIKSIMSGEIATVEFVPIGMYFYDGEYYYIREDKITTNSVIIKPNSEESYRITHTTNLNGIYDVNKGFTQFKLIDTLYQNEFYSIVKQDTPYGIRLYDHIVIDGNKVKENEVIY